MEWPGRDEHWLVRVIELVLDVPRNSTLSGCQPHVVTERCGVKGVAREERALARPSSSWCSTFPRCQPLGITGRYGVRGVAWEGRALARPRPRAGPRRSQDRRYSLG